ncbi:CLUMA_CG014357, isoform A [Clunio marinus]|uniref:CLUMA_CG014357, isoform A n=1 Tax=Clunio marinus TaxID=568069 RepID=A0A1J1IRH7_9DIPT|nr:CLUMA_CG014357, isoform A [Clunio marinus]
MAAEIVYYNPELLTTPTHIVCPKCHSPTNTNVEVKNTNKTHFFAFLMCLVGCCLCAWLPYTINDCRAVRHYCQKCNRYVGSYKNNYRFC